MTTEPANTLTQGQHQDHGPYWVLYGVYRGAIEISKYRRVDGGTEPGAA